MKIRKILNYFKLPNRATKWHSVPQSKDLKNTTKCVFCETLWDAVGHREMKELQACSWACGQDSLLWNILMKLNLSVGSFHQDVFDRFWCPTQMDTNVWSNDKEHVEWIMINRYTWRLLVITFKLASMMREFRLQCKKIFFALWCCWRGL